MELRRDLLIGIGALVAFNIIISFGAIGLLSRMSPAIERILQENVYSIEAAEEMLALVASAGDAPVTAQAQHRFEQALARIESNITEPEEEPIIARIRQSWPAVQHGDASARARLVEALRELVAINRDAMRAVDREAQRLGTAGAWTTVFISFLGFMLSVAVIRRLRRRILTPLADLYSTLEAARLGDPYRRCTAVGAPLEIKRIFHSVNRLLDRKQRGELDPQEPEEAPAIERLALLHLLEQQPRPLFVINEHGKIAAANQRGLDRLGSEAGEDLRRTLAAVPARERGDGAGTGADEAAGPAGIEATPLDQGKAWLCTLDYAPRRHSRRLRKKRG